MNIQVENAEKLISKAKIKWSKINWKKVSVWYDRLFWIFVVAIFINGVWRWVFRYEETILKVKQNWEDGTSQIALGGIIIIWLIIWYICRRVWRKDKEILDEFENFIPKITVEDLTKPVSGNEYIDYYLAYCDKFDRDAKYEWSTKEKLTFEQYKAESEEWPGGPRDYCSKKKTDLFMMSPNGINTRIQFG
jgi:hypothetical protein